MKLALLLSIVPSVPIIDDGTVCVATAMYYIEQVLHHVGDAFCYESVVRFHPRKRRRASHGSSKAIALNTFSRHSRPAHAGIPVAHHGGD